MAKKTPRPSWSDLADVARRTELRTFTAVGPVQNRSFLAHLRVLTVCGAVQRGRCGQDVKFDVDPGVVRGGSVLWVTLGSPIALG